MPLYHKKNDKHNLTKKSNFFHQNFVKSNLSSPPKSYHKYVNLYANLQTKASKNYDNEKLFVLKIKMR